MSVNQLFDFFPILNLSQKHAGGMMEFIPPAFQAVFWAWLVAARLRFLILGGG